MSARVLVVGLDACEVTLVERWSDAGLLPNFARLRAASRVAVLDGPMDSLPGAIWPEINTGRAASKDGHFYVPNRLRTGEARLRATRADEIDAEHFFWTVASRAGQRVAVIDPVQAVPARGLNGVQLFEWGLHDRAFQVRSDPPELLASLRARFGDHPVQSCDRHGESAGGYRKLRDGLLQGLAAKATFAAELLMREAWDLFDCTISESHCAGHQFWHFGDVRHPWHAREWPDDLRLALQSVYQGIDRTLGRLLQAAGREATVLLVFSHGMGLYHDGPQLLPEVLARLGYASGGRNRAASWLRERARKITHLPRPLKAAIKRAVRSRALAAPLAAAGCPVDPFESPHTRAAFVYNNRCGAIRFNIRGREPHGAVEPGEEARALTEALKRELSALRDPQTGEPVIAEVFGADERFGAHRHADIPDVICVFRRDLGLLEYCESPAVGRVHAPIYHPHAPRSGDHTSHSQCWASGAGIPPATQAPPGHVRDIAATVLDRLGVAPPVWLDGKPLSLCDASEAGPR